MPQSAVQLLIDWANSQDNWVRAIVGEVVATRRQVVDAALDRAYEILLAEKELSGSPVAAVARLGPGAATDAAAEPLRLQALKGVSNVNALASGQEIPFNARMTVVFGENAAGKTGYVRVLKRLAAVRSAEPILGNIRQLRRDPPGAVVEYRLGDQQTPPYTWAGEQGVPPFTRVSIFDSRAVALHLDEDLTYQYTPGDLALFRYTHQAIESLKERLEHQRAQTQPSGNPFLARFPRDTAVYRKIETLGPSTEAAALDRLAALTDAEIAELPLLRERVEALQPQATQARLELAFAEQRFLGAALASAKALVAFDWAGYNSLVQSHEDARGRYVAATQTSFAASEIPGVLQEPWQAFVQAGEQYLAANPIAGYPAAGEPCIYCRQPLTEAAVALIRRYREYTDSALKRSLDTAKRQLAVAAQPLVGIDLVAIEEGLARKEEAGLPDAEPPVLPVKIRQLVDELQRVREQLNAGKRADPGDGLEHARELESLAAPEAAQVEAVIGTLRTQGAEREKALEEESAKLRELEARLELRSRLEDIRQHIERARWSEKAKTLLSGRLPALLRGLTEVSKTASEQLLNEDFGRLFRDECTALRAPQVGLDFPGRRGEAARRKTLVPEHRLSEILSEGEQKAIALADFLAECSLRRGSAPIVFDDPVNSLDYKRLEYVVHRLVQLSREHQVIVFTHNIWFATELLAHFEKAPAECSYFEVTRDDTTPGIVLGGNHPRWDTIDKLKSRINTVIQSARGLSGEAQAAVIEKAYDLIRSWCEAVVEQGLFASVTQRYQAHVAMTKLPQIKGDRLQAAVSVILPLFEKACRNMGGHSQPLERLGVRPSLTELDEDWRKGQAAWAGYNAP